ncbi:hypothetical protein [Phaffia rhodozyma]|uniref:Uncharacterized protein n=1 Tax=Phaffia rhodozyma TaxID=264483 RepID=A0A0F7SNE0_PHARH|nr:hypothetical protein [Phaffia rhodozyma]
MSLTSTTFDDQGKQPAQTLPSDASLLPASPSEDPLPEVDESYLTHRGTSASTTQSVENIYGEEAERPTYDEDIAEELGGDYDLEQVGKDYEDDEGDDGEFPELEDEQEDQQTLPNEDDDEDI